MGLLPRIEGQHIIVSNTPTKALLRAEEQEGEEVLLQRAAAEASSLVENWPLAAQHGPFLAPEVHSDYPVAAWRVPPDALVVTAGKASTETTLLAGEEEWRRRHWLVMHEYCQPLGKVPVKHRVCFTAQRCVHLGQGRRSLDLVERLRFAFTVIGNRLGFCGPTKPSKQWNKMLQSGAYVCRFQSTDLAAEVF